MIDISSQTIDSVSFEKLFPNKKLLIALQQRDYEFTMGEGIKIHRQYFASKHRAKGGPKKQRTMSSIVVLKNKHFFRKIPRTAWLMPVDTNKKGSKIWGEVFMERLLKDELQRSLHRQTIADKIDKNI